MGRVINLPAKRNFESRVQVESGEKGYNPSRFEFFGFETGGAMRTFILSMVAATGFLFAESVSAVDMPQMAKKLNCTTCHAIDHKIVGPAWKDVAAKYTGKGVKKYTFKGKEYPLIEGLVMKVSRGGSGNWGTMAMPANDPTGAKKAEITELVKFEQSLAKK